MEKDALINKIRKIALEEIIAILLVSVPLGWWGYSQIGKRFDRAEKEYFRQFDRIEKNHEHIEKGIEQICRDNRDFHGRLCRLEEKYQQFRMDKEG